MNIFKSITNKSNKSSDSGKPKPDERQPDYKKDPSPPQASRLSTVRVVLFSIFLVLLASQFLWGVFLHKAGRFLIVDEPPEPSDAIVVLNTGVEYYPRLIQAAALWKADIAPIIIINGNRKTDILRDLEKEGYEPCCPWYEGSLRVLELYGVPADKVVPVSAEDAYDTVSEAEALSDEIRRRNLQKITLTTSKYHTRRARHIWQEMYGDDLSIRVAAAQKDPFDPDAWWKDGRQIRWLLAEYGAWVYYYWKNFSKDNQN